MIYTGTLELEGSFAIIREWGTTYTVNSDNIAGPKTAHKELVGIHIIPAQEIKSIDWLLPIAEAKVINITSHEPHRA